MAVLNWQLLLCAALVGSAACGSTPASFSDAAVIRSFSLEIQNPPGDSVGLDYSGSVTLRVRYLDDNADPIVGSDVAFTLMGDAADSTGGASLSSVSGLTDELGIARVDLVAGAERVNFRVKASAPDSPSVVFFIQVSDQGFSTVTIDPDHDGPRDESTYDRIELRIFGESEIRCDAFDIDSLPESMFPPRSLTSFAPTAVFQNIPADTGYTVVGWTELGASRPLAAGCLSLSAGKLRSGSSFSAALTISDRSFQMPEALQLTTEIDVSALVAAQPQEQQWQTLACPFGRAQLLLDCMADAQFSDGLLDCDGESQSALSAAMAERRGLLDVEGCRPALDELGADSLDALLDDAMSSGWPSSIELQSLLSGRDAVLDTLQLHSRLTPLSDTIAVHRLQSADLASFNIDLLATNRPIIESASIPVVVSASPILSLARHAFTLRFGDIATDAFESLALSPANASSEAAILGTKLIDGASIATNSGCVALELFVCTELALTSTCADQCPLVAASLNLSLVSWIDSLQSTGMDFALSVSALIEDVDNDLLIDSLAADNTGLAVELSTATETFTLPATMTGVSESQ